MEIGKCDSDLFMLALFCLSSLIPDYLSIRVHDLCHNILIKYGKIPKIKPSDKTSPRGLYSEIALKFKIKHRKIDSDTKILLRVSNDCSQKVSQYIAVCVPLFD